MSSVNPYSLTSEQICLLNLARTSWVRRGGAKKHQLSFSEESITDTILMDLAATFPGSVLIEKFSKAKEGDVGADWAWAFESADGKRILPMLVQAKALALDDLNYPEIRRHIGKLTPPVRQIDRLIKTSEQWGWPAIYAFYNHISDLNRIPSNCWSVPGTPHPIPESWGISIADAYFVRSVLNDQSFDTHRHHSKALHCLLCSMGRGSRPLGGSPELALQALAILREQSRISADAIDMAPLPDEPFREAPFLFRAVRRLRAIDNPDDREAARGQLAVEFRGIAGVVILSDAKQ